MAHNCFQPLEQGWLLSYSETDLDQAAKLFADIILRGGLDIIDMLVGRRALARATAW